MLEKILDEMQDQIEFKYSKKHINSTILDYININRSYFDIMINNINKYLTSTYSYKAKNERIANIDVDPEEIALTILIAVYPIQEIVPIQRVVNKISNLFKGSMRDNLITAGELLAVTQGYYFSLYKHDDYRNKTNTMGIKCNIVIPEELELFLDQVQYLPPMVTVPYDWGLTNISHTDGGYRTFKDSVILGKLNHHTEKLRLDVNNYLQSIPYVLDMDVLNEPEVLSKKKKLDTPKKIMQFDLLKKVSKRIYNEYKDYVFYFVWKNDARGRLYSQG